MRPITAVARTRSPIGSRRTGTGRGVPGTMGPSFVPGGKRVGDGKRFFGGIANSVSYVRLTPPRREMAIRPLFGALVVVVALATVAVPVTVVYVNLTEDVHDDLVACCARGNATEPGLTVCEVATSILDNILFTARGSNTRSVLLGALVLLWLAAVLISAWVLWCAYFPMKVQQDWRRWVSSGLLLVMGVGVALVTVAFVEIIIARNIASNAVLDNCHTLRSGIIVLVFRGITTAVVFLFLAYVAAHIGMLYAQDGLASVWNKAHKPLQRAQYTPTSVPDSDGDD